LCQSGDVEVALERFADAERFQLAAFDLLGNGVAREEGDAEPFPGGALLARIEDTRRKAARFGAYGTTVKAYKPAN
jgi:hypothetical protein